MANMLSRPCFVCMLCCAGPLRVQPERPICTRGQNPGEDFFIACPTSADEMLLIV